MMRLAEENPDIFNYHEGMNGGTNARGEELLMPTKGWYYGHSSPWMKIQKMFKKEITIRLWAIMATIQTVMM